MPSLLAKMKVLLILEEKSWKTEIKLFPFVRCFIWKLELVSDILWVIVASRAFPKATIFVVCTEFAVGLKFHFSQWKINFSQFIFIDKYLKSKEIEYFIHDIKSERWLVLFYVHSYFLLTVELKFGHSIFRFILRFKMETFECGS